MNMMRKNNNNRNNKHRGGSGGGRRYQNGGGGGGNRGANDSGNIARQKHHATQQLGKYTDLARNAQINGDRVDVEYYLQHVDHYTRVLTDIAAIEAERHAHSRESQIIAGGPNDPNAQQHDGGADSGDAQPQEASTGTEENGTEANAGGGSRQPRQPRPQRRPYNPPSDNGAAEANANKEEIPLPGGILPPV